MEALYEIISGASHKTVQLAVNGLCLGLLVTGLAWLIWRKVKSASAATGYVVWWSILSLIIVLPLLFGVLPAGSTFPETTATVPAVTQTIADSHEEPITVATIDKGAVTTTIGKTPLNPATRTTSLDVDRSSTTTRTAVTGANRTAQKSGLPLSSLLVGLLPLSLLALWLIITAGLVIRLVRSYRRMLAIKRSAVPFDINHLPRLQRLLSLPRSPRRIRICLSPEVEFPMAAGLGDPVILIPEELIEELTNNELENAILHEAAHIRRWDDWTLLAQKVLETLAFFHPAVRWIGRQLDLQREIACDDAVVEQTGNPEDYARCLTRLAQLTSATGTALVPGALSSRKQIFQRFHRILNRTGNHRSHLSRFGLLGVVAVVAVGLLIAAQVGPVIALPLQQVTFAEVSHTVKKVFTDEEGSYTDERDSGESTARDARRSTYYLRDGRVMTVPDVPDAHQYRYLSECLMAPDAPDAPRAPGVPDAPDAPDAHEYRSLSEYLMVPDAPDAPDCLVWSDIADEPDVPRVPEIASVPNAPGYYVMGTAMADWETDKDDDRHGLLDWAEDIFDNLHIGTSISSNGDETAVHWSDGRNHLKVETKGDFEFSDDFTNITSISRRGFFYVYEKKRGERVELEIEPDSDGKLEYTYWVDGRSEEFDDEGREWLAEVIQKVVRKTGIGAPQRVRQLLKSGGVDAVLEEIEEIESSYVVRVYFEELINNADLTDDDYSRVMRLASRQIDSDYEKAELLIGISDVVQDNPDLMTDYVKVVESLDSDYETRRVLSAISMDQETSPELILLVLEIADGMDSDYEKAELLIDLARLSRGDSELSRAYVEAVRSMDSDYEKRRVLNALGSRRSMDTELVRDLLTIAEGIDSDYEKAELLIDLSDQCRDNIELQTMLLQASATLDSDYEMRRVLSSHPFDCETSPEFLPKLLEVVDRIDSDYERAEMLIDLADCSNKDETSRRAYLVLVTDLDSDYETKRVLQDMVESDDLDDQSVMEILAVVERMDSDYEKSEILQELVKYCRGHEELEDAFIDVIESMDSDYEIDKMYSKLYRRDRNGR